MSSVWSGVSRLGCLVDFSVLGRLLVRFLPFRPDGSLFMVFLLILDVPNDPPDMGTAQAERAIAGLPAKRVIELELLTRKSRRNTLHLLYQICHRQPGRYPDAQMHMVFHSIDSQDDAAQLLSLSDHYRI